MAKFYNYKVIGVDGEIHEGVHEADSRIEILNFIRSKGQKPIKVEEVHQGRSLDLSQTVFSRQPNTKDLIVFTRQLYTMLNAGMPLISGLEVLVDQSENHKLRKATENITNDVKKGSMLSEAMEKYPKIFPILLRNMIQAGEMTGNLDSVLNKMATHFDKEAKINAKIKRALIYPTVLILLAIAAVTFLLTYVLPVVIGMFENSGATLPLITRIVLAISHSIRDNWYIYLLVIGTVIFSYRVFVNTKRGKKVKDTIFLHFPIIRKPMQKIVTSRFTRTLSTLLSSGIPILSALKTSALVTNNLVLIDEIEGVAENIKKGDSLSKLLGNIDLFPKMTVSMISIGEESGAIEEMLEKTADYYDDELESSLEKLVALIEPIGILVMGLIIGFIIIAMMLPMFEMYKTL